MAKMATCIECKRQAKYGPRKEKKKLRCRECKIKGDIIISEISRLCIVEECCYQGGFNYEDKDKGIYCKKHMKEGMVNVRNKIYCKENGCKAKQPKFNYNGKIGGLYCIEHKKKDMINVVDKRCCKEDNCKKTHPKYNYKELKSGIYCREHKKKDMINITLKLCRNCEKIQPTFGIVWDRPTHCATCKTKDMKLVLNYCAANIRETDPYICTQSRRSGLDRYCRRCFVYLFPADKRSTKLINKRCEKELIVKNFIAKHHDGFIHDQPMYVSVDKSCQQDCTRKRRIDLRKLINNTWLCIEIDENQHAWYDKIDEEERYHDIYYAADGIFKYVFIRYNPDSYIKKSIIILRNDKYRLGVLLNKVNEIIEKIEIDELDQLITIYKLFFDC